MRRQMERELLLGLIQGQLELTLHRHLWEMALPLVDSLTRLDKRLLAAQMQQVEQQQELRELLLEVLGSLQPTASQQLLPRLVPPLTSSSPSSER